MHTQRRSILKTSLQCASLATLGSFLLPVTAMTNGSRKAFTTPDTAEAVQIVLGNDIGTPSSEVIIDAPGYIKKPSIVEITVSTEMADINAIAILIPEHPLPLVALYTLPENTAPFITTRLDIHQTSEIIAVVKSGEQLFSNYRQIIVTETPKSTRKTLDTAPPGE